MIAIYAEGTCSQEEKRVVRRMVRWLEKFEVLVIERWELLIA